MADDQLDTEIEDAAPETPPAAREMRRPGVPLDRQFTGTAGRQDVARAISETEDATFEDEYKTKFREWRQRESDIGQKLGAAGAPRSASQPGQNRGAGAPLRAPQPPAAGQVRARGTVPAAARGSSPSAGRPAPSSAAQQPQPQARPAQAAGISDRTVRQDAPFAPAAPGSTAAPAAERGIPIQAPGSRQAAAVSSPPPPVRLNRPESSRPDTASGAAAEDRLRRNQRRADEAVRKGNPLVGRVASTGAAQKMAEQVASKTTSQVWYWGFGAYLPTFLVPGTLVMDFYWLFLHRRNKELFPMPGWQKAVTLACNLLTLLAFAAVFVIVVGALCATAPTRLLLQAGGAGGLCDAMENGISTMTGSGQGNIQVGEPSGPSVKVGNTCYAAATGPASIANLSISCFGQANAPEASAIAYAESGGNALSASRTDVCATDGSAVSFGLFQINISAHKIGSLNCPAAFNQMFTASTKSTCRVVNQSLYQQCVQAAKDAATNIQVACQISGNGSSWSAWGANLKCGF